MARWISVSGVSLRALPESPAVYAKYRLGQLVYIGQTKNLRQRFSWYGGRGFDACKVRFVEDRDERLSIERRLVARLRPPRNHTFVKHQLTKAELIKAIRDEHRERSRRPRV